MSYFGDYEEIGYILEECKRQCPWIVDHIVGSRFGRDECELIVELDDCRKLLYDTVFGSFRVWSEKDEYNMDDENRWRKEFGRRLKHVVRMKGIPLWELSRMTGISETSLSRYMNYESTPSLYKAIKIAKALDWDLDDLADIERIYKE